MIKGLFRKGLQSYGKRDSQITNFIMSNDWKSTFAWAGKRKYNRKFDYTRAMIGKSNRIPAIPQSDSIMKIDFAKSITEIYAAEIVLSVDLKCMTCRYYFYRNTDEPSSATSMIS